MSAIVKPAPGSQLFGLQAIAAFVHLSEAETLRRLESGEIPAIFTAARKVPIADKAALRALRETPHFQRKAA